jgi:AcrR family transcriptional regulator
VRVSDEAILAAAARVIGELGPSRFTLADVGAAAGLAAPTLVKRFGTKRGLMLALVRGAAAAADAAFAAARARHAAPLDALADVATAMARAVASPAVLANHLAFLQLDLSDPEFHAHALAQAERFEAGYRTLLDEAVARGDLASPAGTPFDTARLARAVQATAGGALIAWAVRRDGAAAAAVARDVETLLAPYRAPAAGARRPAGSRRATSAR